MFDSTLHAKTLARQIRRTDFHSKLWSFAKADQPHVIEQAIEIGSAGFSGISFRENELGKKPVYQHSSLSEALLTRHVSESIRRITNVRQSDRQSIIKSLMALAAEGVAFKVFKMDIKSFYESVDTTEIVRTLKADGIFSRQSIYILESFFDNCEGQNIPGLPRGIGLSATLAEYAMRSFDSIMSAYPGVRFYNRYVDDAIMVVSDDVDLGALRTLATTSLPSGLQINRKKTKDYIFLPYSKNGSGSVEQTVSFLGYDLKIGEVVRTEKRLSRSVIADISSSKVSNIKRRLTKAILAYNNDHSFLDLIRRVKLLTSNHGFIDSASGQQRFSGLRYNYGLIDVSSSNALTSLDRYMTNILVSKHPKNRLRPVLTELQLGQLMGLRFSTGFTTNRFSPSVMMS